MQRIIAEVEAEEAQEAAARQAAQMEAQRLRQEQGQLLAREFQAHVARYEELRHQLHAHLGLLFRVAQDYSRLAQGTYPPTFMETEFMSINLPSLVPSTNPYAQSSPFTTTRGTVMGFYASTGQDWPPLSV